MLALLPLLVTVKEAVKYPKVPHLMAKGNSRLKWVLQRFFEYPGF